MQTIYTQGGVSVIDKPYGPSEWVNVLICGDVTPHYVTIKIANRPHNSLWVEMGSVHRCHPKLPDLLTGGYVRVRRDIPARFQRIG